jgi:hypothetical protein
LTFLFRFVSRQNEKTININVQQLSIRFADRPKMNAVLTNPEPYGENVFLGEF